MQQLCDVLMPRIYSTSKHYFNHLFSCLGLHRPGMFQVVVLWRLCTTYIFNLYRHFCSLNMAFRLVPKIVTSSLLRADFFFWANAVKSHTPKFNPLRFFKYFCPACIVISNWPQYVLFETVWEWFRFRHPRLTIWCYASTIRRAANQRVVRFHFLRVCFLLNRFYCLVWSLFIDNLVV